MDGRMPNYYVFTLFILEETIKTKSWKIGSSWLRWEILVQMSSFSSSLESNKANPYFVSLASNSAIFVYFFYPIFSRFEAKLLIDSA